MASQIAPTTLLTSPIKGQPNSNGNGTTIETELPQPEHYSPETAHLKSESRANRDACFVCHGMGHWARECTSLPSSFLKENAPHCYSCSGLGHYARFCPNVLFGRPAPIYYGEGYSPIWYPPQTPLIQQVPYYVYGPVETPPGGAILLDQATEMPRCESAAQPESNVSGIEIVLEDPIIDGGKT